MYIIRLQKYQDQILVSVVDEKNNNKVWPVGDDWYGPIQECPKRYRHQVAQVVLDYEHEMIFGSVLQAIQGE